MINYEIKNKFSEGSNSIVYECKYNNKNEVAKVPKQRERYISFNMQVNSMKMIFKHINDINFIVPKVLYYDINNIQYGELLIMEKINNLYSIDFVIRKSLVNYEFIIVEVAKAISKLHMMGISGYDIEFYWNIYQNKLVLLDIGQQHTIGVSTEDMIKRTLEDEKDNIAGLWNIISATMKKEKAMYIYEHSAIKDVTYDDIIRGIKQNSLQIHIENVAKSHYIQLIGSLKENQISKAIELFIKTYKNTQRGRLNYYTQYYIYKFKKSYQDRISHCHVQLYYSKYKTLSTISNSNNIECY